MLEVCLDRIAEVLGRWGGWKLVFPANSLIMGGVRRKLVKIPPCIPNHFQEVSQSFPSDPHFSWEGWKGKNALERFVSGQYALQAYTVMVYSWLGFELMSRTNKWSLRMPFCRCLCYASTSARYGWKTRWAASNRCVLFLIFRDIFYLAAFQMCANSAQRITDKLKNGCRETFTYNMCVFYLYILWNLSIPQTVTCTVCISRNFLQSSLHNVSTNRKLDVARGQTTVFAAL